MSPAPTRPGAAELIRSVGLLADGPVRWGDPLPSRRPGVYLVELAAVRPDAPLELARVGKWLERLPGLRLDGEPPTSKSLASRIASLWWPESTVLYAGATERSIGGRAAALYAHVPGDRQPHPDGQWIHLLRAADTAAIRLWWAETDAPEEYLDALLDAFEGAAGNPHPGRPTGALALPWANGRRPTGERQAHGITGAVVPEPPPAAEPARHVVEMAPGDAEGARPEERGSGTTRRAPKPGAEPGRRPAVRTASHEPIVSTPRPPIRGARTAPPASSRRAATATRATPPAPVELSQAAVERLRAELDELTRVRRPEVVARIRTAREHGDLKENAEYHAAREEQSFLEGRVQALEDRLRRAVVVEQEASNGRVMLGSKVTVEVGGDELVYTVVGSAEADLAAGRLSSASPVGAALLGASVGTDVDVQTPRGAVRYRVVSVD